GWPETPPTSPPFGFADSIAGISAAMGTAMALYRRSQTGVGEEVDVALYEPLMFIVGDMLLKGQTLGEVQGRGGNGTGSAAPRGIYKAGDGHWLAIAASNQGIAKRLFAAMGQPELIEDPRYATNAARMQRNDELQAIVSAWVSSRPRAEILKILDEYEVVASPVNDSRDIVEDPHFLERTLVPLVGNDGLGSVLMPGPVLHMRGYEGPVYDGVPTIGQHTAEILEEFGVLAAQIESLQARSAISGS